MLFDDLLKDSELTRGRCNDLDHKMKRDIMEKAGMEIVLDTNVLISSLLKNCLTRKDQFSHRPKMCTVDYAKWKSKCTRGNFT